jgi:hypothetical protein
MPYSFFMMSTLIVISGAASTFDTSIRTLCADLSVETSQRSVLPFFIERLEDPIGRYSYFQVFTGVPLMVMSWP